MAAHILTKLSKLCCSFKPDKTLQQPYQCSTAVKMQPSSYLTQQCSAVECRKKYNGFRFPRLQFLQSFERTRTSNLKMLQQRLDKYYKLQFVIPVCIHTLCLTSLKLQHRKYLLRYLKLLRCTQISLNLARLL